MNELLKPALISENPMRFLNTMQLLAVEQHLTVEQISDWCDDLVNDDQFWEPVVEREAWTRSVLVILNMIKRKATGDWYARSIL